MRDPERVAWDDAEVLGNTDHWDPGETARDDTDVPGSIDHGTSSSTRAGSWGPGGEDGANSQPPEGHHLLQQDLSDEGSLVTTVCP